MATKKQNKIRNTDWESIIAYTILSAGMVVMIGATLCVELDKTRALYKPGHTLSRRERAAVDSLHDPQLEQHKKQYSIYYQDYMQELGKTPAGEWPDRLMHRNKYMPGSKCAKPTIGEYHAFLKDYEQKVIERKYQELNAQLQKQK